MCLCVSKLLIKNNSYSLLCPYKMFTIFLLRNFRCDCGNGKFGEFKCQLILVSPLIFLRFSNWITAISVLKLFHLLYSQAKDEQNDRNQYNHNFNGCYCTCDRPYPDADDQVILFIFHLWDNASQIIGLHIVFICLLHKTPFFYLPNSPTMRWFSVSSVRIGFIAWWAWVMLLKQHFWASF